MQGAKPCSTLQQDIKRDLIRMNFKSIEHKFKAIICGVKHLYKYNTPNHKLKDIFICQEHRDIADMVLQTEKDIILASRQSYFKNMSKYLKLLQPAMLDNLARIGGYGDGGYIMLPPPHTQNKMINRKTINQKQFL